MSYDKPFDTNIFFSGGAGMFLEYHDIVKPVYLYAIIKLILTQETFGFPIQMISSMSTPSIIEWYTKRRFKNIFQCLDYQHQLSQEELDTFLYNYLMSDNTIYKIAPGLNIQRLFSVYVKQHMTFPVYIYSEKEELFIKEDCKHVFPGIHFQYVYGNLKTCVQKCDQNFTYIFSDIELVKEVSEILKGTCSHVLLASDYRYNYKDNCKTFKYSLIELARMHPFIRIGTTQAMNNYHVAISMMKLFESRGG